MRTFLKFVSILALGFVALLLVVGFLAPESQRPVADSESLSESRPETQNHIEPSHQAQAARPVTPRPAEVEPEPEALSQSLLTKRISIYPDDEGLLSVGEYFELVAKDKNTATSTEVTASLLIVRHQMHDSLDQSISNFDIQFHIVDGSSNVIIERSIADDQELSQTETLILFTTIIGNLRREGTVFKSGA